MRLLSAGLVLFQIVFGTTPNIAPPSNLKLPFYGIKFHEYYLIEKKCNLIFSFIYYAYLRI
jgi:hypothetical protein